MSIALTRPPERKTHLQTQSTVCNTIEAMFTVRTSENSWLTTEFMPKKIDEILDVLLSHLENPLHFHPADVPKWVQDAYEVKQSQYLAERITNLVEKFKFTKDEWEKEKGNVRELKTEIRKLSADAKHSKSQVKRLRKSRKTLQAKIAAQPARSRRAKGITWSLLAKELSARTSLC